MSRRTSRSTSYTSGVSPVGPFRAKVVGVSGGLASIQIPRLGLNNVYEDVPYSGFVPSVGTDVWAFFIEGNPSRPMIIVSAEDSLSDINEIVAGTNLNGGGTGGSVTLNLDDAITLSTVTADEFYGDLHGAIHLQVKNVDSVALSQGDPVYATGAVGASGAIEVQGSSAGSAGTMPAMGLLDQDLAVNAQGDVVVSGVLQNFDTDTPGYSVGDELYVAPSGGLTTTRPSGSSELVQKIGKVIRVQQNTGEILVQGAGRTNDVPNSISITGDMTVGGDATVTGDLTVNGTTVTLNTETLTVEDNIIVLNSNVSGTPTLDAGIEVERGTSSNRSFLWDESIDAWTINTGVDGNLLRLTGADDNLNISVSAGDFSILNSQQSNGIVIYDGTGGVEIFYNGSAVFEADSGGVKVDGSRILTVADEGSGNGLDADTVDSIQASSFLRSDAADTATGQITFTGNIVIDNSTANAITLYTEQGTARIADTFSDNSTFKSYISFGAGTSSNDPGYIMHETSDSETNEGVLHLAPSDDNAYGDYVSIHGTNDADSVKIHTDGSFEGVASINGLGIHSGRNNEVNKLVRTDSNGYIQAGWINTTSGSTTSTISRIYASNDAYIRYVTPATFRSQVTDGVYEPVHTHPYIGTSSTQGSNLYIRNGSPTVYHRDTNNRSAMVHVNSNFYYVLRGSGNDSTTWSAYNGIWPFVIYLEDNEARFGGQVTVINMSGTSSYNTVRFNTVSGQLMQYTSLAEFKTDVVDINGVLGALNERSLLHDLRPVLFHEDQEIETTRGEYIPGFIAEEVHEVAPELTYYDKNGELISYAPESLVPHLVAEIQRLTGMVEELYQSAHPDWVPPQPRPSDRGAAEKAVFDAGAAYAVANPVVTPDPELPTE